MTTMKNIPPALLALFLGVPTAFARDIGALKLVNLPD